MNTKIIYSTSSKSAGEHLEVRGRQSQRTLLGRQKGLGGRETHAGKFPWMEISVV